MPHEEYWTSGGFEANMWFLGDNWQVDNGIGNPSPASRFNGSPELTNYVSPLRTYYINGQTAQFAWIDGETYLDFDLGLSTYDTTGTEKLIVRVVKPSGIDTIHTFSNDVASYAYQSYHFRISDYVVDEIFQVEFRTVGEESSRIEYWTIDNIEIYLVCHAPRDLDYEELGGNDYLLSWQPPEYTGRSLVEYNIYQDQQMIDATLDTFYLINLPLSGNYTFRVTAVYEDCESYYSEPVNINVSVGLKEYDENRFVVYPNPVHNNTVFKYSFIMPSTVTISIFNTQGKLIEKIEQEQPKGEQQVQWNAEGLPAGMYYFRIQAGDKVGGGKMVKMR